MANKSLAQTMVDTYLLVGGLRTYLDRLRRRGIDESFVASIEDLGTSVSALNAEQEALKSQLKVKTDQLNKTLAALKAKSSEARKLVKLDLGHASWKAFGIQDKR